MRRKPAEFVKGDLVMFTGYDYTPDYVYIEDRSPGSGDLGIVISNSRNGYYSDVLYRVYWLTTGHITTVVNDHLRLAYVRK